jgi:hypothetical protein
LPSCLVGLARFFAQHFSDNNALSGHLVAVKISATYLRDETHFSAEKGVAVMKISCAEFESLKDGTSGLLAASCVRSFPTRRNNRESKDSSSALEFHWCHFPSLAVLTANTVPTHRQAPFFKIGLIYNRTCEIFCTTLL